MNYVRSAALVATALGATAAIIATAILFYVPFSNTNGVSTSHSSALAGSALDNASQGPAATKSSASPTAGFQKVNVTVNGDTLIADIADTQEKMYAGLSVRDSMNESEGMLFPFATEQPQGFWMKGMKFPIDIIWLDKDKKVVHIEPSLTPCTPFSCPTYTPSQPSLYVLETVSGFAAKHDVKEGTVLQFDLPK